MGTWGQKSVQKRLQCDHQVSKSSQSSLWSSLLRRGRRGSQLDWGREYFEINITAKSTLQRNGKWSSKEVSQRVRGKKETRGVWGLKIIEKVIYPSWTDLRQYHSFQLQMPWRQDSFSKLQCWWKTWPSFPMDRAQRINWIRGSKEEIWDNVQLPSRTSVIKKRSISFRTLWRPSGEVSNPLTLISKMIY